MVKHLCMLTNLACSRKTAYCERVHSRSTIWKCACSIRGCSNTNQNFKSITRTYTLLWNTIIGYHAESMFVLLHGHNRCEVEKHPLTVTVYLVTFGTVGLFQTSARTCTLGLFPEEGGTIKHPLHFQHVMIFCLSVLKL